MAPVIPDLPAHGRSTGLHVYITKVCLFACDHQISFMTSKAELAIRIIQMEDLAEAVDAVICEVALKDEESGKSAEEVDSRKRFIAGASMGQSVVMHLKMRRTRTTHSLPQNRWFYCSIIYNVNCTS